MSVQTVEREDSGSIKQNKKTKKKKMTNQVVMSLQSITSPNHLRPHGLFRQRTQFPARDEPGIFATFVFVVVIVIVIAGCDLFLKPLVRGYVAVRGRAGWPVDVWMREGRNTASQRHSPHGRSNGVSDDGGGVLHCFWF